MARANLALARVAAAPSASGYYCTREQYHSKIYRYCADAMVLTLLFAAALGCIRGGA